jgi:hypothetical protein
VRYDLIHGGVAAQNSPFRLRPAILVERSTRIAKLSLDGASRESGGRTRKPMDRSVVRLQVFYPAGTEVDTIPTLR